MRMFIGGQWCERPQTIDIVNLFDGKLIDIVPNGSAKDVDLALTTLVKGAAAMRAVEARLPNSRSLKMHNSAGPWAAFG